MSVLNEPVLVLNRNWVPIETVTVARAFSYIFAEKAKFIDPTDCSLYDFMGWADLPVAEGQPFLRTSRMHIRAPEIIVLTKSHGVARRKETMAFSRRNLCKRDMMTCQYCGSQPIPKELTIDHIVPKKRGGKSSWTNCVMSCFPCNSKKADKMLAESGLKLMHQPYEPKWSPIFRVHPGKYKESWKGFVQENAFMGN